MANGRKEYFCFFILFLINLLNYVDRETVAGVLTDVQAYYSIDDSNAGLIQTVFLVAFVIGSPICGYLGDRYNRKWVICAGMTIWVLAVIASSLIPKNLFWFFLFFRGVVGIGEASYSNVSPSMICDMFTGQIRNNIYMVYYLAVPFGSGLGYIVGSKMDTLFGSWQWGVRITAVAGILGILALAILVDEPERGAADREETGAEVVVKPLEISSIWEDMWSLCVNPTFIYCTIAYTSLVFVAGTMLWWTPTAAEHRWAYKLGLNDTKYLPDKDKDKVNSLFGVITMISGILGVTAGTLMSGMLQHGKLCLSSIRTDRAPSIICALGSLAAFPLMLVIIIYNEANTTLLWVLTFFCVTFLCLNWGLNVDIIMSVVVPWRRSTAFSWFMLSSHLLGDGPGPYIVGAISDAVRKNDTPRAHYKSLVVSFYLLCEFLAVSAIMYTVTAVTMVKDQNKVRKEILANARPQEDRRESDCSASSSLSEEYRPQLTFNDKS